MSAGKNPFVVGGRVNERQLQKLDAAARLAGQPRAHFLVDAALERAGRVLRRVASEDETPPKADSARRDQDHGSD